MEQRLTSSCVLSDKDLEVGSIWQLSRCRDIIVLRPLKLMAFRKEAYCYFKLMQMSLSDERLSFKISQLDKIVSIDGWQSNSWEQMELFEHQINSDALPIRISFPVPSQVNLTAKPALLDWPSNENVDENLTSTCATWQRFLMQRLLIYWQLLDE